MERKTNEAGKRPAAGLAIASLVLGILAVVLSFLLVGGVLGVIGLGLGLVHLRTKDRPPSLAGAGMVLSIVGNMATLGFGRIYFHIRTDPGGGQPQTSPCGGKHNRADQCGAGDSTVSAHLVAVSALKSYRPEATA